MGLYEELCALREERLCGGRNILVTIFHGHRSVRALIPSVMVSKETIMCSVTSAVHLVIHL